MKILVGRGFNVADKTGSKNKRLRSQPGQDVATNLLFDVQIKHTEST